MSLRSVLSYGQRRFQAAGEDGDREVTLRRKAEEYEPAGTWQMRRSGKDPAIKLTVPDF